MTPWRALLVGCCVSVIGCGNPTEPETVVGWDSTKIALVEDFDRLFGELHAGAGCRGFSNDDGTISWAESYILMSFLDMYRGTGRVSYLDRFVMHADAVLLQSDSARGVEDYRGVMTAGWSATRYGAGGERAHWIVDDGIILEQLLRFAILVNERESLRAYRDEAAPYVLRAQSVMASYDHLWRSDESGTAGQYVIEPGAPTGIGSPTEERPVPINWETQAGIVHVLLWRLTGDETHRVRAELLGQRFRGELEVIEDRYAWHYWGAEGRAIFHSDWEDISHAYIDVTFANDLLSAGLAGFEPEDRILFTNALLSRRTPGGGFYPFLEVDLPEEPQPDPVCGRVWSRLISEGSPMWLVLGDVAIYDAVYPFLLSRLGTDQRHDPVVLAGLARLISWYDLLGGESVGATR